MPHRRRIGMQIGPGDPYWVQVRELIGQRAQTLSLNLVEVDIQHSAGFPLDEQVEVVEDLLVQDLQALIGNALSPYLLTSLPDHGIPIIYLPETPLRHPGLTSHHGLYTAAHLLGQYVGARMAAHSSILLVNGHTGDDYHDRRHAGFLAALPAAKHYVIHDVLCEWNDDARLPVAAYLREHPDLAPGAIVGLSDSLALGARDACRALGRLAPNTLILGINGDPLALAAVTEGSMTATVETDVADMAAQALELACQAAQGAALPPHFQNRQQLVTRENVMEAATRKLVSLAGLPTRLVGVNRQHEQQRVVQLETSLAINRQVGLILDAQQLSLAITALIRDNYGFDQAQFLIWNQEAETLVEVSVARQPDGAATIHPDPTGPLAYVLIHDRTIFIPNVRASQRFPPDPAWPEMQARVVVPVHLGGQIVGLLDLHNRQAAHRTREELDGLQVLADQVGVSMRNAELYGQALAARELAEKADRLKTGLLANVSHELRTPLNVILGYSQAAIDRLAQGERAPAESSGDLTQIHRSGQHLLRLITDLLDLSRAEIDELDLLPEHIETRSFLEDVFRTSADHFGRNGAVAWQMTLPADLPAIEADPVRLRQVLLNLLHNAHKFTPSGRITLGAAAVPSELHLWVADTGEGIRPELQEQIFEPFISVDTNVRRHEGIGLGLSIARRLVALHRGRITVESRPGDGSTFHIYLPLPPADAPTALRSGAPPTLLLIADSDPPPAPLIQLAAQRGLALRRLRPDDNLPGLLETTRPTLLAWDLAAQEVAAWSIVRAIQAHPQLNQLPLLLYNHEPGGIAPVAAPISTGVLLKPSSDSALIAAITNLRPHNAAGTILIVEDDPQTRALHRRIITEHLPGYQIHDVDDGRAALDVLAEQTPSLLVLDLAMPDVDGFAVLAALRAQPRTAGVPVLVLSGRVLTPDDIARLVEARVIFQTKDVLSEGELAASLRRTVARDTLLPPPTSALVKQAIAFIQQHYSEPLSRQEIAGTLNVSKDYLGRIFHQELGLSPWEYLIRYRVLRAKELLWTTSATITEVARQVGFDNAAYFSHIFQRETGYSPRAFRQQMTG